MLTLPIRKLSMTMVAATVAMSGFGIGEEGVQRLVEMRDGTRIRVSFPSDAVLSLRRESLGAGVSSQGQNTLPVSGIAKVSFSKEPALDKLTEIQKAVRLLDSDAFLDREEGQARLMKSGQGFRAILEQRSLANGSAESLWRLRRVLLALPKVQLPDSRLPYDIVRTADGSILEGDFGEWSLNVRYRDQMLTLSRTIVQSISADETETGSRPELSTAAAVSDHEDDVFADGRTIDFETDPFGKSLEIGDDIGMRFADWGVTFQTSIPGKFVSVNDYEVSGPSRRLSAATHDPLYEGTVTIRFCVPGNPGIPAGVNAVGAWMAIVVKDGTAMQAYDVRGNLIKEVRTASGPSEFLGIRSSEPIHAVRLVPNAVIDPNYTIDDLVYSKPVALDSVGVEGFVTMRLRNGDRLICSSIADADADDSKGDFTARLAHFPEAPLQLRKAELAAIHAPLQRQRARNDDGDLFWVESVGGSRLLVSADPGRKLHRFPELAADDFSLLSLWGYARMQMMPPTGSRIGRGEAMVIDGDSIQRTTVDGLGENWLLGANIDPAMRYATSPTVWFDEPKPRRTNSGTMALTFTSGETLDLQGPDGFRLIEFTSQRAVIGLDEKKLRWEIPLDDIAELRFGAP